MGQTNSPADPSTLVPLSVTDPAFSYLQQLSIFQQPERNQELLTRMAQILGTQQPQPDPVSRIPMANMILPLMGGGMQMGSTAEAPPLSPEQSKMGVAQSAQFQPVADIAGLMAGSMRQPGGQAVLASERGAIGEGVEQYVWQANKQGGQTVGNKQVIAPLTKEVYEEHVAPKVGNIPFTQYRKQYPASTHVSLVSVNDGPWKMTAGGTLKELRPSLRSEAMQKGWVKRVESFDDPDAIAHRTSADTPAREFGDIKKGPGYDAWIASMKRPIAYHGTSADFGQFGEEGPHFLTSSKEEAARYAGKGGRVVSAEVQMKNPYVVGKDKVLDQMFDDLGGTDAGAHYDPAFQKAIQDRGYDGMISEYGIPGDWNKYYMVLKGNQIKPVK